VFGIFRPGFNRCQDLLRRDHAVAHCRRSFSFSRKRLACNGFDMITATGRRSAEGHAGRRDDRNRMKRTRSNSLPLSGNADDQPN
jgi:hypothetical protein